MVTTKTKKPKIPTYLTVTRTCWLCTDEKKAIMDDIKGELSMVGWSTKKDAINRLGCEYTKPLSKPVRARITVTEELL